jgi:hypothetical protein
MKKSLLGSTALIGASLLMAGPVVAQGPELSVGGKVKFEVWFDDQDTAFDKDRDYHFEIEDAELVFNAKATADNGLKYGAKLEVQFDNSTGDGNLDEARLQLSGVWGTLQLGNEDGPEAQMVSGAADLYAAQGGPDGSLGNGFSFLGAPLSSPDIIGDTSDSTKVIYYTPRFAGIQLGVAFTPDTGQSFARNKSITPSAKLSGTDHVVSSEIEFVTLIANSTVGVATAGAGAGTGVVISATALAGLGIALGDIVTDKLSSSSFDPLDTDLEDVLSAGINYVQSFNGVDIALGVVGVWADGETSKAASAFSDSSLGSFAIGPISFEDLFSWQAGAVISFAGFSIGGEYGDYGDSLQPEAKGLATTPLIDFDRPDIDNNYWAATGKYSTGPFAFSVGYFSSDSSGWLWRAVSLDTDSHKDDENWYFHDSEVDVLTVGAQYSPAPGLKLYAEWDHIDVDRKFSHGVAADLSGGATGTVLVFSEPSDTENDGSVFIIGANISF